MKQDKANHAAMAPDWFNLNEDKAYKQWRAFKCAAYPTTLNQLVVKVSDANYASPEVIGQCQVLLNQFNMFIYRTPDASENKKIPLSMGNYFGLHSLDQNLGAEDDGVTKIEVKSTGVHGRYIPYTPSKLSWHTDGYYNTLDRQIRGMALHCVRPAEAGGENALLDHEMAYIYLRDLDPDFIRVLSLPDAMTIPENVVDGKLIRAVQTGPVFSFDRNGDLHMRYSARKRNIVWKSLPELSAARAALDTLFDQGKWVIRGTLKAGDGLICNNVLHNRSEFENLKTATRLLYRLRYYERAPTQVP